MTIVGALVLLGLRAYQSQRDESPVSGLAPGACRRQGPQGHDRHVTVFIDAGHGSPDPGGSGVTAAGKTVYEKDLTLATARRLSDLLRTDGYTIVLSRTQDGPVARIASADLSRGAYTASGNHRDLEARVNCANGAHAQLLLSLHFNAFDDSSVGGAQTFYDDARSFAEQNRRLAGLVQNGMVAQLAAAGWQVSDRGATVDSGDIGEAISQAGADYGHLFELGPAQPGYLERPSGMPGVLLEPLFLSNSREATIAASPAGQDAIARGVAIAVEQFAAGR